MPITKSEVLEVTMNDKSATFVKRLMMPVGKRQTSRKAWSIDLESVWIPFFTATNTEGASAIPAEALGCPLRLGYDKSGGVRFSQSGKPVIRVAKELSDSVRIVRENFTATLIQHYEDVQASMPKDYEANVKANLKAGEIIAKVDSENLAKANALRLEKQLADSMPDVPETVEKELVAVS
jgi:hypothetical protein